MISLPIASSITSLITKRSCLAIALILPSKLNLPWTPYKNYWPICEDSWICVKNRHIFEEHGCTFAPSKLAARFSHESDQNMLVEQGITPFAFHGRGLLPKYKHLLST